MPAAPRQERHAREAGGVRVLIGVCLLPARPPTLKFEIRFLLLNTGGEVISHHLPATEELRLRNFAGYYERAGWDGVGGDQGLSLICVCVLPVELHKPLR